MKRYLPYLLSTVSSLAFVGASAAADLPVKAPVAAAPIPWSWSGFYIGANIGAASARSSISDDPGTSFAWLAGTSTDANKTGVIGGLQAGYNWQISNLVLGVEGDISFASLDRSVAVNSVVPGFDTYSSRLSALGTLRGRIGWAFDRVLIYGTGGFAFANLKDELTDTFAAGTFHGFTAISDSTRTGWTAGGGIEYAFLDHWTVKAEYLHVGFGDRTVTDNLGNGYAFVVKDSLDIGRVGLNYKF